MVVNIEGTHKLGGNYKRGVAPRGCGTCEYTQNGHNSVIFAPRSLNFFVVVDIDVTDKLGKIIQKGCGPRGRGTCKYTQKWP